MKLPEWNKNLGWGPAVGYALGAILSFHLAYTVNHFQLLLVFFFYFLLRLANLKSARIAFYAGLAISLAIYAPHLAFFWKIFQSSAIALWVVLSCWLGLFLLLGQAIHRRFGLAGWACAAPFVWLGIEYFRSELYYLRFSWLNAGYAFSNSASLEAFSSYGVYGIGFILMTITAILAVVAQLGWKWRVSGAFVALLLLLYPAMAPIPQPANGKSVRLTGVQFEFPSAPEILMGLNQAIQKYPDTQVLVLSEYSLMGPIPNLITTWCRKHQIYLVIGAEEPVPPSQYYNTVFVIDPQGKIVFQQAKCVPVQFMKDGLPAVKQALWESPWGKLGMGICYDASYTRVVDELIRQGAQGLIFPTMDTEEWGGYQHRLHARIAPMRAAEYAVPVFRLCSSGISQFVDSSGQVRETAPFPGQGAIMSALVQFPAGGRMPPDRWLARLSVAVTAALSVWLIFDCIRRRRSISSTASNA